jgi:uncharacterized repeat protein (TIGR01451 family)
VTFYIAQSYLAAASYESISFVDTIPVGLTYVPGSATYADSNGDAISDIGDITFSALDQTLMWNVGSFLGPNDIALSFKAVVDDDISVTGVTLVYDGETLTNTVDSSGTQGGEPLPAQTATADVTVREPFLGIEKTGTPNDGISSKVLPGESVHVMIVIENSGDATAYDIEVSDSIPAGLMLGDTVVSSPAAVSTSVVGSMATGYDITWIFSSCSTSIIIEYDVTVPAKGGAYTNTASIDAYSTLPGTVSGEHTYGPVSDTWDIEAPGTELIKVDTSIDILSPGGIVTFTITIENTGAFEILDMVLEDYMPSGLLYIFGSAFYSYNGTNSQIDPSIDLLADGRELLSWEGLGSLDIGETSTMVFNALVLDYATGTIHNEAYVTAETIIGDVTGYDDEEVAIYIPSVDLEKYIEPDTTYIGGIVTVTLVVTNTGEVLLDPVLLVDGLPPGLTYEGNASPSSPIVQHVPGGTMLTWSSIGPLEPDETATITFEASFNGSEAQSLNIAAVIGTPPNGSVVTDSDFALIRGVGVNTQGVMMILARNLLNNCQMCSLRDLFLRAHENGLQFDEEYAACCHPEGLVEALASEAAAIGMEEDGAYLRGMALVNEAREWCDKAHEAYDSGQYALSHKYLSLRCTKLRLGLELILDTLFSN